MTTTQLLKALLCFTCAYSPQASSTAFNDALSDTPDLADKHTAKLIKQELIATPHHNERIQLQHMNIQGEPAFFKKMGCLSVNPVISLFEEPPEMPETCHVDQLQTEMMSLFSEEHGEQLKHKESAERAKMVQQTINRLTMNRFTNTLSYLVNVKINA